MPERQHDYDHEMFLMSLHVLEFKSIEIIFIFIFYILLWNNLMFASDKEEDKWRGSNFQRKERKFELK